MARRAEGPIVVFPLVLFSGILSNQLDEELSRVLLVDQSSLGKTPRSNPGTYTKAFDQIREIFAPAGSDASEVGSRPFRSPTDASC